MNSHRIGIDIRQHWLDLLVALDFRQNRRVFGFQDQPVCGMFSQRQPSITIHRVGDIDQQRLWNGEAGIPFQHIHDLLGVMSRSTRVPQRQWCNAVRVYVLWSAFQFCKRCQRVTGIARRWVIDLQQDGLIGLNDQRYRRKASRSSPFRVARVNRTRQQNPAVTY